MRFKIDTEGVVLIAGGIEGVTDRDTSAVVLDKETGKPLFVVHLMAVVAGEKPEQMSVRVPGQPSGIGIGSQVRVHGLFARTWEMGDWHGLSFRAISIEPTPAAGRSPEKAA